MLYGERHEWFAAGLRGDVELAVFFSADRSQDRSPKYAPLEMIQSNPPTRCLNGM